MMMANLGSREAGVISAAVCLVLYMNTLDCSLVYDDEQAISKNGDLRATTPWSLLLVHDFWGTPLSSSYSHKSYRPLCVATFRLNYLWHGLSPLGYHVVNVCLHAIVCYLYVQLCALIFNNVWPALLAGLLFAAHPIHTEAVAGVVGRAELLSATFFLSSFLLYHKSVNLRTQGSTSWVPLVLSLCSGLCAMLSKEQGITVFGVSLFYDIFVLNQLHLEFLTKTSKHSSSASQRTKNFFVRGVVVSSTALIALMVRLQLSNGAPTNKAFASSSNPPVMQSSPWRQLSWLHLVFVNVKLLIFPSGLTADWRYGAAPVIESIFDWNNVLTALVLVAFAGFTLHSLTKQSGLHQHISFMGLCLTVLPFLPASNLLFPIGFVVAERVLYLPSMGFCLLAAYGLWMLLKKYSRVHTTSVCIKTLVVFLLVVFSAKTLRRNRDWYSSMTINRAGAQFNPRHAIMLSNLGIEHALKEDYHSAEVLYHTGMLSHPYYSGAFHNYGLLMNILHRYNEAEEPLRKAILYGASDSRAIKIAESYSLLSSIVAMNSSRLKEALHLADHVLNQYPEHTQTLHTRCSILLQLNKTSDFIYACEKSLWYNQGDLESYYNLGVAYARLGYLSDAEKVLRKMLQMDGKNVLGKSYLAGILQGTGKAHDLKEARHLLTEVVSEQPYNHEALLKLSEVESELHRYKQALNTLNKLLQVHPHHTDALYQAGQLHIRMKHYQQAQDVLSRLLHFEPDHSPALNLLKKTQKHLAPTNTS